MSRPLLLVTLAATLGACQTTPDRVVPDYAERGVGSVNVPVVTRADYAFDLASPDGALSPSEAARLDGWFRSLELGYGDTVYVQAPYAYGAREAVGEVAGRYGLLVDSGAPVTAGAVLPGTIRVVVARTRASVPGCPNWQRASAPNYGNLTSPNFGCATNSNLAAMVANPQDLVFGQEGSGVGDNRTAVKALETYRKAAPTGTTGLKDISTKGN